MADPPGDIAAAIALLWPGPVAPKRGPRPTLTLPAIAAAGIAIADTDGLAAVTMQRVAAALGVTKMALYRYVPGKVELVALMTDLGIGEPPRLDGDWRARLHAWSGAMFQRLLRHPWCLETLSGRRAVGPNELGWLERALAALTGTGLTGAEMLDVVATLAGHARAMAQQVAALPVDLSPDQSLTLTFATLVRGREAEFPALAAALGAVADGQDQALDFGLDRILDGVELLIRSRG